MIAGTKIKLTLMGLFALGLVVGVAADSYYRLSLESQVRRQTSGRSGGQSRTSEILEQRLNLRPDQVSKVNVILGECSAEYVTLRAQIRPQFDEIRNRQRERIRAILDPEQQKAYSALIDEHEARRRAEHKANP